jgi:hypothetical protein
MPRGSVEEREAVQLESRRERAEQKVFKRPFGGAWRVSPERRQRVGADRHRLETEEDRQEVPCRSEDHCAEGREQKQRVELATVHVVLGQVSAGEERREPTAQAQHPIEEQGEAIDRKPWGQASEPFDVVDAVHPHRCREGAASE